MMGLWLFNKICFWMFQLKLCSSCTLNIDIENAWAPRPAESRLGGYQNVLGDTQVSAVQKKSFFLCWLFSTWSCGSHGLNHDFLWNGKAQAHEWILFLNASLGGDAWWEGNVFQFPRNKGNKAGIAARIVFCTFSPLCVSVLIIYILYFGSI